MWSCHFPFTREESRQTCMDTMVAADSEKTSSGACSAFPGDESRSFE